MTSSPAMTSTSLLASAMVFPGFDRRQHGLERRRARRGAEQDVDVGMRRDVDQPVRPRHQDDRASRRQRRSQRRNVVRSPIAAMRRLVPRDLRTKRCGARPAASPTTRSRSGCASTTASALVPMEPVDPRIAMRFTTPPWTESRSATRVDRNHQQQRVDAIEHAAVAGDQLRAVLYLCRPFQRPTRAGRRRCPPRRAPGRGASASGERHRRQPQAAEPRHGDCAADEPADRALDGLLRADGGRQQRAAEQPPRVVLRCCRWRRR